MFILFSPENRICLSCKLSLLETGFVISCKLSPVSNRDNLHERQILFSGENKKNITSLSSAELPKRVVRVNKTHWGVWIKKPARRLHFGEQTLFFLSVTFLRREANIVGQSNLP